MCKDDATGEELAAGCVCQADDGESGGGGGFQLDDGYEALDQPLAATEVPQLDGVPPVITLLGDGPILTDPKDKVERMEHILTVGQPWLDPGVSITDNYDLSLNVPLLTPFTDAVPSEQPTPADAPIVLTFSVKDASGNVAVPVGRIIHVQCPPRQALCPGDRWRPPSCAASFGVCGLEPALQALDAGTVTTDSVVGNSGPRAPDLDLRLLGPPLVRIPVGAPYAACTNTSAPADQCDHGVEVEVRGGGDDALLVAGSLRARVLACAPVFSDSESANAVDEADFRFDAEGLRGCGLDTSRIGNQTVVFSLTEAGVEYTASRTIRVVPVCVDPDVLCPSERTCSSGGSCGLELAGNEYYDGREQNAGGTMPVVTLSGTLGPVIQLRQHSQYEACGPRASATARVPCEEGAIAVDVEDGDLTGRVWLLPPGVPPERCLSSNCNGYEFWHRGTSLAELNSSATPGTVFELTFAVLDGDLNLGSAVRRVAIVEPCAIGQFWCDGACAVLPCDRIADLLGALPAGDLVDGVEPATVSLRLTGSWTDPKRVILPFGVPDGELSLPSLMPCDDDAADSSWCGVVAEDIASGEYRSAEVAVTQVLPGACDEDLSGAVCDDVVPVELGYDGGNSNYLCSPAEVVRCPPGAYVFRYSLGSATIERLAVVTPMDRLVLRLAIPTASNTLDSARSMATALAGSPEPSAELRQGVASALRQAGVEGASAELVAVSSASASAGNDGDGGFRIIVDLVAYLPTRYGGVGAALGADGRRRLRQSRGLDSPAWLEFLPEELATTSMLQAQLEAAAEPGADDIAKSQQLARLTAQLEALSTSLGATSARLAELKGDLLLVEGAESAGASDQAGVSSLLEDAMSAAEELHVSAADYYPSLLLRKLT